MPSVTKPLLSKSNSPLAVLLVLAAQTRAYATFIISALLIGVFYLRLIVFSFPIHAPESIRLPHLALSIPLWLPVPRRPRRDMTFQEWRDSTAPNSVFSRLVGLDCNEIVDIAVLLDCDCLHLLS